MNIPFPIIEKINLLHPPNITSISNNILDAKNKWNIYHTFLQWDPADELTFFTQKHSSLKLEYEKKASMIEKSLIEQNTKLNSYCQNLETQCQNMYHHIVQLTRRIESLEEKPKWKKSKHAGNTNCSNNPFILPVDIDS